MYSTAVLFETTLVMAVHALDCGKDLGMYEAFISSVTEVLRDGRHGGAREFYTTADLNVESELMCTDEERHRGAPWDVRAIVLARVRKNIMAVSRS